jgi:hypothetical protein
VFPELSEVQVRWTVNWLQESQFALAIVLLTSYPDVYVYDSGHVTLRSVTFVRNIRFCSLHL